MLLLSFGLRCFATFSFWSGLGPVRVKLEISLQIYFLVFVNLAGSVDMLAIRWPAMKRRHDLNILHARRVASASHPE
uniref:Uncharacterized protein n=1 Tax=Populus trichocarpa TaxID=3694 RepID=A0A2K1ZS46_POPTR